MVDNNSRVVNFIFWGVSFLVAVIAVGSFVLSFNALHELAKQNKQPAQWAWIWPVIVDLSLVIYTAAILVAQLMRWSAKLPILLTIGYGVVTVVGNVLHAPANWEGYFVAIMPPLSLVLGTELLRTLAKSRIERQGAIASLSDLSKRIKDSAVELDKLIRQIEEARSTLDRLKSDVSEVRARKRRASVEEMHGARKDKINNRRQQVASMLEAGHDESFIAGELDVSVRTIRRDMKALSEANGKVA
jgi:hypothetical protein